MYCVECALCGKSTLTLFFNVHIRVHLLSVTAGLDCMVFVSDFHSGDVLKKIDTANSFVFSLDISADNSVFATAAQDGCVRIYGRNQDWQCQRYV